jgi:hypothetical protein
MAWVRSTLESFLFQELMVIQTGNERNKNFEKRHCFGGVVSVFVKKMIFCRSFVDC